MPSFSQRSLGRLESCHEVLQTLFLEVVAFYDCSVLEGYRSPGRQRELVALGFSKRLDSLHTRKPALAVDIVPYPFKGADWKNMKRFYHFAGFVSATFEQMKRDGRVSAEWHLVSGLDWDGDTDLDDQSFMDGPHFELRQAPLPR